MSSLLSTSVECTGCAAHKLTSCKLRKWNLIAICACCALGFGGLSLSVYLYNKHARLKKSLDDLEEKLELLTQKFDTTNQSNTNQQQQHKSRRSNYTSSSFSSRRSSLASRSESDSWNTPNTSPTRTVKSVEFLLDEDHNNNLDDFNEQSVAEAIPQTTVKKTLSEEDFLSDNRSLELLQMQTLEDKNVICVNNQAKYENDPSSSKFRIDYIKSLYVLSESETDIEIKKELRLKAYELAKTQLETYPDSYLSHKWYAITAGRVVDYYSINEKVKLGFEFKDHLDIAIGMNDSDYLLFYLRGRWSFKMLNLSWAERYGVRLIFGKIPNVSIQYAMEDFLKVEELHKNKSKGSTLHLAKCYINQGNIDEAVNYLNIAKELPTRTNEHLNDNEEIESLLKQYSS